MKERLRAKLGKAEEAFFAHLGNASHNKEVDFAQFLEFQLLRVGAVDKDTLQHVKDHWASLDKDGTGKVKTQQFVTSVDQHG